MYYESFGNEKLSALGLGCMRLPTIDNDNARIDEAATAEMVDYALKNGINYFDTAWGYHAENSELVVGKLLAAYPRDSYAIASKFPGYHLDFFSKKKEIFERQLEKCRVDYFDYYLFHNVYEKNADWYLDRSLGLYDYLVEEKKRGRIRHLGFSTHGNLDTIRRFLDAYREHLEFCQIQLNWFDWQFQNAKEAVAMIRDEYHLPIWVMEPLRGGNLASLSPYYRERLLAVAPDRTPAEWAFSYLQSIPGVTMILSGMSDLTQVKQNIKTFEKKNPLNKEEVDLLHAIAAEMIAQNTVPCTSCRYCVAECPQGLDIPHLLYLYNEHNYVGRDKLPSFVLAPFSDDKRPSACLGCQSCESVCPQSIKISTILSDFAAKGE